MFTLPGGVFFFEIIRGKRLRVTENTLLRVSSLHCGDAGLKLLQKV